MDLIDSAPSGDVPTRRIKTVLDRLVTSYNFFVLEVKILVGAFHSNRIIIGSVMNKAAVTAPCFSQQI